MGRPTVVDDQGMMHTYRETFRAHWKILLIPVIVAAAVGGWITFGATKTYSSTATVWIDDGPAAGSWLDPTVAQQGGSDPPAAVLQAELAQFLDSNLFDLKIGERSSLRAYLTSTPSHRGSSPEAPLTPGSGGLAGELEQSVYENVTSTVMGSQVLSLSYTGPTKAVSRSVLSSLLSQLQGEATQLGVDFSVAEARYYVRQLTYRQKTETSLQQAAAAYLRQHPTATAANSTIYAALLDAVRSSSSKLATQTAAIRAARFASGGDTPLVRVIDQPSLPTGPVNGLGAELEGPLAGAFAGLVLSLLVTILLTPASPTRWDQEEPRRREPAAYAGDWAAGRFT